MGCEYLLVTKCSEIDSCRFGGSGTTANTLVYVLWACLERPDIVQKLQKELRQHWQNPRIIPDYKVREDQFSYINAWLIDVIDV